MMAKLTSFKSSYLMACASMKPSRLPSMKRAVARILRMLSATPAIFKNNKVTKEIVRN